MTQQHTPTLEQIEAALAVAPYGSNDPYEARKNREHRAALRRMLAKARGEA